PSYLYILPPSPALRLLPSFPTRRSSDLAALGLLICAMATNLPMLWIGTMLAGLFSVAAQILIPLATMAVKPEKTGEVVGFLMSGDRKSTRLNSSHVKISYAVFCLKKKIT